MPRTTHWSGAAGRTERSRQRRSWHWRAGAVRLGAALLGVTMLAGCTAAADDPEQTGPRSAADPTAAAAAPDPALGGSCTEFWGDPDFTDPLSRVVLDRAATAPDVGPSDPSFYVLTGDDIDAAFEEAPEEARRAASALSQWFRTEPEQGPEADREAFRAAWEGVAGACQGVSAAASWTLAPGEAGTKPATLVCADVFDTPGTLTHFSNANVLTSNMFKLVGLHPLQVPADRSEDVQATADLLAAEIAAVDDDAVRAALEQVRAPFQQALDGDTWSDGLHAPLTELAAACDDAGYSAPETGEIENGAVTGAAPAREGDTDHGGQA